VCVIGILIQRYYWSRYGYLCCLELIGIEGIPGNTKVNYWATKKGLVIGMDDGTLRNLTAKYFHFDTDANKGTSVLRSENGQNHIITITN